MKIQFVVCLLIVFMVVSNAFAAASPELPDPGAFAGSLVSFQQEEDFGFCKRVTYQGATADIKIAALAYVALLEEKYQLQPQVHFTVPYDSGTEVLYVINYVDPESVSYVSYENVEQGWKIDRASIVLTYTQRGKYTSRIQITYVSAFRLVDNGDRLASISSETATNPTTHASSQTAASGTASSTVRATQSPTSSATAKATSKPNTSTSTRSCSNCGGDGKVSRSCSNCGGDGDIERNCANCGGDGKRDCLSCHGKGYDDCSGCSGDGERRCGRCNGTGEDWKDDRCNSCGGDGEVKCSSCSGSGNKRCSACSGSGDRRCSSCSGRGTSESRCSACSGSGRREATCSTCGGSGSVPR